MATEIYRGEALLKRWGDSSSAGRTITLQIDGDGPHQFKGFEGERFAIVVVALGNDQKAVDVLRKPDKPKERKRWNELRGSARAALLVQDDEFLEFAMQHRSYDANNCNNADEWLKTMCRVHSKREFDTNTDALQFLDDLTSKFRAWQQSRGHGVAA